MTKPETIRSLSLDRRDLYRTKQFIDFLSALNPNAIHSAIELLPNSHGENFQDIFALLTLNQDRPGFFVEFGATDGIAGSNSYMMETCFGWNGILAEPARVWHPDLHRNRKVAITEKCVWSETGRRLVFRQSRDAGFSSLETFWNEDRHADKRRGGQTYEVETISLNDLLSDYGAPRHIDYLSIDTEGSEFAILQGLDFDKWQISIITVEHNYRPEREKILGLMRAQGYVRAPTSVSKYDDWYVSAPLVPRLGEIFRKAAALPTDQSE